MMLLGGLVNTVSQGIGGYMNSQEMKSAKAEQKAMFDQQQAVDAKQNRFNNLSYLLSNCKTLAKHLEPM